MFRFASRLRFAKASFSRQTRGLSGHGAADTNTLYGRMMASNPLLTSALTGSLLWSTGDVAAQVMEMKAGGGHGHHGEHGDHGSAQPVVDDFSMNSAVDLMSVSDKILATDATSSPSLDLRRIVGTLLHGSVVGGAGTYLWYNTLDSIVRNTLRLTPGGAAFVFAKLGLEIAIWHPTSLLCYWTIVGTAQGHEPDKIMKELQASFVSTLIGDAALWTPIDILCFWKIPVALQTLFANGGSFIESVALSYIHDHGLDIFSLLSSSSAVTTAVVPSPTSYAVAHTSGGVGVAAAADDTLREKMSRVAGKYGMLSKVAQQLLSIDAEVVDVVAMASKQFDKLDIDKDGKLSLSELRAAKDKLPGVEDKVVGKVVLSLITRKLTSKKWENGAEAEMTKAEYIKLLDKLHGSGYRKSQLLDVVFTMFDDNNDGTIDTKELGQLIMVSTGSVPTKAVLDEIMAKADKDKDGKLSKAEFITFMQSKKQGTVAL